LKNSCYYSGPPYNYNQKKMKILLWIKIIIEKIEIVLLKAKNLIKANLLKVKVEVLVKVDLLEVKDQVKAILLKVKDPIKVILIKVKGLHLAEVKTLLKVKDLETAEIRVIHLNLVEVI
jgi:hypothetical protein